MKKILIAFFIFSLTHVVFGQVEETEIFIIDSYVTPESPYKVKITFFTSDSVKSKIVFSDKQYYLVSEIESDEHRFQIRLDSLKADSSVIPYKVLIEKDSGEVLSSDTYDLYLPEEFELKMTDQNNFINICIGSVLFLIPLPAYAFDDKSDFISITKEFPIISFYGKGYNYPSGYISLEYSYIFEAEKRNYLRLGYKHIFQTDLIKYISPGLNLTTNFSGFHGISPEISLGLFEFSDAFTLYIRYRYNFDPNENYQDFHDISFGLFTSSFSFNL